MTIVSTAAFHLMRSHMIGRMASALAILLVTALGAMARDVTIGTVSVGLTAPEGQCELDANLPSDARTLNLIKTVIGNQRELLAMYADCAQLEAWRKRTRQVLDDFLQYQTLVSMKSADATAETIKHECNSIRVATGQSTAETAAEMNERAAQVIKTVKFNEGTILGVAAEDDKACYAAMLQRLTTEFGNERTLAILIAITVVKGKMVTYIMYTPYIGTDIVSQMLIQHRVNVAAFLAANQ
jgi:hypothetical protein